MSSFSAAIPGISYSDSVKGILMLKLFSTPFSPITSLFRFLTSYPTYQTPYLKTFMTINLMDSGTNSLATLQRGPIFHGAVPCLAISQYSFHNFWTPLTYLSTHLKMTGSKFHLDTSIALSICYLTTLIWRFNLSSSWNEFWIFRAGHLSFLPYGVDFGTWLCLKICTLQELPPLLDSGHSASAWELLHILFCTVDHSRGVLVFLDPQVVHSMYGCRC